MTKSIANSDLEAWLNENPDIKQDFEEQTGPIPIRSRNDLTKEQVEELDRLEANIKEEPSSIERLLEEVSKVTSLPTVVQTTQAPSPSNEISLGAMPQFAEIIFRPNGEIWLNTDTIQLAIQPGISRILLGQPT